MLSDGRQACQPRGGSATLVSLELCSPEIAPGLAAFVLGEPVTVAENPCWRLTWRGMDGRLGPGPRGEVEFGQFFGRQKSHARLLGGRDVVSFELGTDALDAERGMDQMG